MALTAFLDTLDIIADGSVHVIAVVTDNVAFKIQIDRILPVGTTAESLKALLRSVVAGSAASDDLKTLPLNSPIDLTPDTLPDPTPDELAQRAFVTAYNGLQNALRKVAAGVVANTDADVVALVAQVQKLYLPAYLTLP